MSRDDIDKAEQRAKRYWYEDGISEIAIGCLSFLVGVLFYVEANATPDSLPSSFSAIGLPLLIIGGGLIVSRLVKTVKERITYPRTGYVAYCRTSSKRRFITGAIAGFVGAIIAVLLRTRTDLLGYLPVLEGLVIGAALLYMAHSLGVIRFYFLSVLSAIVGAVVFLEGLENTPGLAVYFMVMGIALIVSGFLTLWNYLSKTQPPVEV